MNIEFDLVVSETVENMLPRFSRDDLCLIIPVEIKVWNVKTVKNHKSTFLLFHRNSNYTKVLMAKDDNFDPIQVKEWSVESYHDSCWRSDGFSSLKKTYQKMIADLKSPPNEIGEFISFGLTGPAFYQGTVVISDKKDERIALVELKKKYYNFDIIEKTR